MYTGKRIKSTLELVNAAIQVQNMKKNGCEKSWMKSNKVRLTLPIPFGPFGENCSKENVTWISDDYFLAVNWWFYFWFVQSVADLPSEYWQIQRLIKFLKVRVSVETMNTGTNWQLEARKATNRGKQYGIMARKWLMKKSGWLFHGRTDVGNECWAKGLWQNSPLRISPFALAFLWSPYKRSAGNKAVSRVTWKPNSI